MKKILSIFVAFLFVFAVVGCNGEETDPTCGEGEKLVDGVCVADTEPNPDPDPDPETDTCADLLNGLDLGGATITFATTELDQDDPFDVGSKRTAEQVEAMKAAWETLEQKYNFNIEYIEYTSSDHVELITTSVAAGEPYMSIGRIYQGEYRTLVNTANLADVTEAITSCENSFSTSYMATAGMVMGKSFGVSRDYASYPELLWYDIDYIKDAGLKDPAQAWKDGEWDWDYFKQYLVDLQETLPEGNYALGTDPWWLAKYLVGANGQYLVNPQSGEIDFVKPNAIKVFNYIDQLKSAGVISPFAMDEDGDYKYRDFIGEWEHQQKSVFATFEMWRSDCCIRNNRSDYGFVPYPMGPDATDETYKVADGGGDMIVVPKGVEHANEIMAIYAEYTDMIKPVFNPETENIEWATRNSVSIHAPEILTYMKDHAYIENMFMYSSWPDFAYAARDIYSYNRSPLAELEAIIPALQDSIDELREIIGE